MSVRPKLIVPFGEEFFKRAATKGATEVMVAAARRNSKMHAFGVDSAPEIEVVAESVVTTAYDRAEGVVIEAVFEFGVALDPKALISKADEVRKMLKQLAEKYSMTLSQGRWMPS